MVDKKRNQKRIDELKEKKEINQEYTGLRKMINSPDVENQELAEEIIKLKIKDVFLRDLSDDQKYAFVKVIQEFNDQDHDAILLKGYAGTGKTFLTQRIVEYLNTVYPYRKIGITAPTNKAVSVLYNLSPFKNKTTIFEEYGKSKEKLVYTTIHKLLGLKEKISADGVQSFVSDSDNDLNNYSYIIVDEVSMLADSLFNDLIQYKDAVKFLFVGDSAQLPPVNYLDSIPFKKNNYKFLELTLNEPQRQSLDNPIIDIATQIRNNLILQDPIRDLVTTESNNKGIKVFNKTTQRSELKEVIKTLITDPQFQEDTNFVKILAWRNAIVKKLNSICRNILYGTAERFVVGDKLVAQKALFRIDSVNTRYGIRHFYKLVCNTSDEFTVTAVNVVTKTFKEDSYKLVKFTGSFWKLDVNITNKENEHFVLYVIHESSLEDYKQVLREAKKQTIGIRSSDPWIAYYNILKWSDNVDYNYALTVHRSQGSTFKNVVLIEEDIEVNPRVIEKNRMRYTAYTRASDYIYTLK